MDIEELSAADLDRVSGGNKAIGTDATQDLRDIVAKVDRNMAQKEMIRQAQRSPRSNEIRLSEPGDAR